MTGEITKQAPAERSRHVVKDQPRSNYRPKSEIPAFLRSDPECELSAEKVKQIEEKRKLRLMKYPTLSGRHDFDSFVKDLKSYPGYKKWYDEGDFRANAPCRDYDNIVDPVSGFVSAGGDIDRKTGRSNMESLVQLKTTPNSSQPGQIHSVRSHTAVTPKEVSSKSKSLHYEPGMPTLWNSRKISDARIRSDLGGWTSSKDPRVKENPKLRGTLTVPKPVLEESIENRDQLALNYMYGTSTSRQFREVPWDEILRPKQWPPASTLELRPDMISQRFADKKYEISPQDWQATGRSWDWFQSRQSHIGVRPATFCSPCPRRKHIPLYSGCTGGDNLGDIDNPNVAFIPYTVKRVNIPRYVETGHRPDIPGYTGCTLYRGQWAPMNSRNVVGMAEATTATTYRPVPVTPNSSDHKRESKMSKMVTTVPPHNPFNQVTPPEELLAQ